MTVSGLFRWFLGWVQVETEGGYPERLLNEVARRQLSVWGVRRRDEWTRFNCLCRDYRYLRRPARRACVRMRVRHKRGLPFLLHRYRHRKGLLVGAALYLAVLLLLSPRIWVIQVEGCTEQEMAAVLTRAEAVGVRVGAPMDSVNIKELEINGTDDLPGLSFMTVNPSGCVARIQVARRKPTPQVLDLSTPSNMVAVRDGVVLSQRVVSGESRVMVGEAVRAGTILIGGCVETERGEQRFRSYGEVYAETSRRITVTVPLAYERVEPTGTSILRPTVTFLFWEIPLYATQATQEESLRYSRRHFLTSRGMTLPLGITCEYDVLLHRFSARRSPEQAKAMAQRELLQRERQLFEEGSYTVTERQEGVKGDAYTLTVDYTCRENIAVEVPLEG
ncbi:MAG: hypothetical protein E7541_05175 [Ruminococcaceae bacterium]|nr:hypothetical protein [Oscillospiraceae bacterium]